MSVNFFSTIFMSVNLSANKMRDTYVTLFVAEHDRPLLCHVLIYPHFVIRLITIKACVNQLVSSGRLFETFTLLLLSNHILTKLMSLLYYFAAICSYVAFHRMLYGRK